MALQATATTTKTASLSQQPSHVRLQTSQGSITLELYWKHAPRTCANFAQLAQRGYYNGTPFHRMCVLGSSTKERRGAPRTGSMVMF